MRLFLTIMGLADEARVLVVEMVEAVIEPSMEELGKFSDDVILPVLLE